MRDQLDTGPAGGTGGNARFVRQLAERSVRRLATRAGADGTITPDESRMVTVEELLPAEERRAFGFGV